MVDTFHCDREDKDRYPGREVVRSII